MGHWFSRPYLKHIKNTQGLGASLHVPCWEDDCNCPAKIVPCHLKIVKIAHFVTKTCPAAPVFALQEDDIFIVGRVSHPPNPPKVTPLRTSHAQHRRAIHKTMFYDRISQLNAF